MSDFMSPKSETKSEGGREARDGGGERERCRGREGKEAETRDEVADGAEGEEDEGEDDEEDDSDEDDDDDEPDDEDDGDGDNGGEGEDKEEETEEEVEGGFPKGGGRGGGLPWGVSAGDFSHEPRGTIPGSSRGRPFHLVFRARNSRLCLALSPLARSFLLRVAAWLRVPLWVFPTLGLEGSEGSEFP